MESIKESIKTTTEIKGGLIYFESIGKRRVFNNLYKFVTFISDKYGVDLYLDDFEFMIAMDKLKGKC
jgi:hypothetical protein